MSTIRVVVNAGKTGKVREELVNGKKHLVVPSYTLPDGVIMNRVMYPGEEIAKGYKSLEGTFAPVGHPKVNGQLVNAGTPAAVNSFHIGAYNQNVERRGTRVYLEKWIDVSVAEQTEKGKRVLEAIANSEVLHTSTALTATTEKVDHPDYDYIARDMVFDHDCILLDEPGAATPEQGVGMLVNMRISNAEGAVLDSASYGEMWEKLGDAVRVQFKPADGYAHLQDFDSTHVIYSTSDASDSIRTPYVVDGGTVTFGVERVPVRRRSIWVAASEILRNMKNAVKSPAPADKPTPPEAFDMDKAELVNALETANKPLLEGLTALTAALTEQSKTLANASAGIATLTNAATADLKSRVVAHYGEKIANAASPELLADLADKIPGGKGAASQLANSGNGSDEPDFSQPQI